jgi:hypothetical protein
MVGFEQEAELSRLWEHPDVRSRLYMWRDFKAVAQVLSPDLVEGAFERRPCRRRLRYVGIPGDEPDERFELGRIYTSLDFSGATYTIEENGVVIGCAYFEVVEYL